MQTPASMSHQKTSNKPANHGALSTAERFDAEKQLIAEYETRLVPLHAARKELVTKLSVLELQACGIRDTHALNDNATEVALVSAKLHETNLEIQALENRLGGVQRLNTSTKRRYLMEFTGVVKARPEERPTLGIPAAVKAAYPGAGGIRSVRGPAK